MRARFTFVLPLLMTAPLHAAPMFLNVTGERTPVMLTSQKTMDAEIADLDGDGDLDIVLALEWTPNIVLYNDGSGRFPEADAATLGTGANDSEDIALGDFNGDGRTDIVIANEDTFANECYLQQEDGTFSDVSANITSAGKSNAVVTADLDDDGHLDLVLGNNGQNALLLGNGDGTFRDVSGERLPQHADITQDIELGDVDGDGDLDMLLGNEDDNRLLLNDGRGFFVVAPDGALPKASYVEETREADLADVDGDGDLDAVFANVGWRSKAIPTNRLLINDGSGVFTDASVRCLPGLALFTLDVDLVDLDGDGDLDWISAEMGNGGPTLLLNDGEGVFTHPAPDTLPEIAYGNGVDVEVADLDADQHLDLFITQFGQPDMLLTGITPVKD